MGGMAKWGSKIFWVSILLLAWSATGCSDLLKDLSAILNSPSAPPPTSPGKPTNPHLFLGNPSGATPADSNNYLMVRPQYVLSYNSNKGIPNWVSWQLNRTWLGDVPRRDEFRPDDQLPPSWKLVKPSDYNNSGFDRGHMLPSGDRTRTVADNASTFVMTNILPQAPDNNRGPWAELEDYCRDLVRQEGRELYIIVGGAGTRKTIADGRVTVPASTWKVIVVMDRPGLGIEAVTPQSRVIAVEMPNRQGIREKDWQAFRVSVDQIEQKTGYDLLSNVPTGVQQVLESRIGR